MQKHILSFFNVSLYTLACNPSSSIYLGSSGRARSSASSRTMSRNVRRLQEAVNTHLNNYEKELFLDALNEFHSQRDTWGFVEVLRTILNTPAKQQLVSVLAP